MYEVRLDDIDCCREPQGMRFVPTYCLREGMTLGDNLYNNYGDLMLAKGTVLTIEY